MKYSMSFLAAMAVALSFAACAHDHDTARAPYTPTTYGKEADNTAVNGEGGMTAGDQSEAPADREITRHIRRTVVQDDRLSVTAKNVKIITQNGHVTLRGPVKNATERRIIAGYARDIAGIGHVSDQLEVR
jgi:hyperosmotically inducible protein